MPLSNFQGDDEVQNGVEVQHHGLAIIAPAELLQSLVEKSNEFISEHRHWLAGFPQRDEESSIRSTLSTVTPPTSTNPAHSLITQPPSLELRNPQLDLSRGLSYIPQLCDCTSQVTAATASIGSILSASILGLQSKFANASSQAAVNSASLDSAKIQLAGFLGGTAAASSSAAAIASSAAAVQASATAAIAAAQSSADLQVSAALQNVSSANAAALLAQSSASSASSLVLIAQSSASSASIAAAVASASAQQILSIANSVASDAKATATLALAQALATISSVNMATQTSLTMSASKFAAIIIFSVLGTALISVLSYYIIIRYRKARKIAKELIYREEHPEEFYEKSMRARSRSRSSRSRASSVDYSRPTSESGRRSESRARKSMGNRSQSEYSDKRYSEDVPEVPLVIRQREKERESGDTYTKEKVHTSVSETIQPPPLIRTNTLIYDPNEPEKPPRFKSWLTQSVRSVSPFGDFRDSKDIKAAKKKEEENEIRKMALRKAREGEERKEAERRKRESDERRLRARVENEEVVRKVSQRRIEQLDGDDEEKPKLPKENRVDDSDDEGEDIIRDDVSYIGTAK